MSYNKRRYSDWLLDAELRLTRRRDRLRNSSIAAALLLCGVEAVLPWHSLTPLIPWWVHIAAAVFLLPVAWGIIQRDFNSKQLGFATAMNDLGRRLLFLDNVWDTEHSELAERYEQSVLRPTQRAIQEALPGIEQRSLRDRVAWYYKAIPSSVYEADRLGLLGILHPRVALGWGLACFGCVLFLPLGLFELWGNRGITLLVLLIPAVLIHQRYNTRNAFELALYDWLRLG